MIIIEGESCPSQMKNDGPAQNYPKSESNLYRLTVHSNENISLTTKLTVSIIIPSKIYVDNQEIKLGFLSSFSSPYHFFWIQCGHPGCS